MKIPLGDPETSDADGIFQLTERLSKKLLKALQMDLDYAFRAFDGGRPAAVLILFAVSRETRLPSLLVTRRTETLETHKGQYALPGGMRDPEDQNAQATALRETHEEVGVPREGVTVLGELPPLSTPSGFRITPVIGVCNQWLESIPLRGNPTEIAEVFWVPLAVLQSPGVYRSEIQRMDAIEFPIEVFQVGHHRIWGVTGAIIKNLISRMESVEN